MAANSKKDGQKRMRTWRDIPQNTKKRPQSATSRRRRFFSILKFFVALVLVAVASLTVYELVRFWKDNPEQVRAPANKEPIKDLQLSTDGVLNPEWAWQSMQIPQGAGLMDVDLDDLHNKLVATGQVQSAVISRKFPASLKVTLRERTPIARVVVQSRKEGRYLLLAARDGTLYAGANYETAVLDGLPYLDGVRIKRKADGVGFEPILGMESVADFLGAVQANAHWLYRGFEVISLARFEKDRVLMVKTKQVKQIVFSTRDDYYGQLARLDLILDDVRRKNPQSRIKSIDLSVISTQVPIVLE